VEKLVIEFAQLERF